jgi:hypothetical protein
MSTTAHGKLLFAFATCPRCREQHRHLEVWTKGLRSYWRCGACLSCFRIHNIVAFSLLWGCGMGVIGSFLLWGIDLLFGYELNITVAMIAAGLLLGPIVVLVWPRMVKLFLKYEYVGRNAL